MKASIIAAAAITGIASATQGGYSGGSKTKSSPFIPGPSQYVIFADNIQAVSQKLPNTAFLRSQNQYVITPNDFGTASSFTIPDIATGKQCSLNFFVPSVDQVYGDTDAVIFSGSGSLNFSQSLTDLPSGGLTLNSLSAGGIHSNGDKTVIPGQNLALASFPCPSPGTVFPGLISSPAYGADTTLVVKDTFGPSGVTGLFIVVDGVSNPPVSPPPPSSASAPYGSGSSYTTGSYATGSYTTGSAWPAGASSYGTYTAPDSYATYSSAWHS